MGRSNVRQKRGHPHSKPSPVYDSVGALYLANELIWLEGLQVNGYPSVSKLATERADFLLSSGGGPVDAQVEVRAGQCHIGSLLQYPSFLQLTAFSGF